METVLLGSSGLLTTCVEGPRKGLGLDSPGPGATMQAV